MMLSAETYAGQLQRSAIERRQRLFNGTEPTSKPRRYVLAGQLGRKRPPPPESVSPEPVPAATPLDVPPPAVERIKVTPRAYAPLDMLSWPSWRFLAKYAALRHGVYVDDVLSDDRTRTVSAARHLAMVLIYQHTQFSMLQIAQRLDRDHSVVVHAMEKHGARGKLVEVLPEFLGRLCHGRPRSKS